MVFEITVRAWDMHNYVAELNRWMGSHQLWLLDNNTDMNKQYKKKTEQIRDHQ